MFSFLHCCTSCHDKYRFCFQKFLTWFLTRCVRQCFPALSWKSFICLSSQERVRVCEKFRHKRIKNKSNNDASIFFSLVFHFLLSSISLFCLTRKRNTFTLEAVIVQQVKTIALILIDFIWSRVQRRNIQYLFLFWIKP